MFEIIVVDSTEMYIDSIQYFYMIEHCSREIALSFIFGRFGVHISVWYRLFLQIFHGFFSDPSGKYQSGKVFMVFVRPFRRNQSRKSC